MIGRVALLGGTFDPPHIGHLVVAHDVAERLAVDRLLVVVASRPPHREAVFPAKERLELVQEVFAGDDRFAVSDAEMRRPGFSYTVDTLDWVRETLNPGSLYLVIGADQLGSFGSWHRPERILELATLAVMTRPGEERALQQATVPFVRVDVTRVDLSSTQVRERLASGRSIRYLVPEVIRGRVEEIWATLEPPLSANPSAPEPGGSGSGRRNQEMASYGETDAEC